MSLFFGEYSGSSRWERARDKDGRMKYVTMVSKKEEHGTCHAAVITVRGKATVMLDKSRHAADAAAVL